MQAFINVVSLPFQQIVIHSCDLFDTESLHRCTAPNYNIVSMAKYDPLYDNMIYDTVTGIQCVKRHCLLLPNVY